MEHNNSKMSRFFYSYGKLCASHPMEVIIAVTSLSIFLWSIAPSCSKESVEFSLLGRACQTREVTEGDALIVTVTRYLALLYVYHQFRSLYKLGSKYLIGIASVFAIFSSVIFSSGVMSVLNGDFGELKTAMPLFLLLADLPKASLLAQFALSSYSREEVRENIARGMGMLGPSRTLDTLVETLAMGVGTLSGVQRMEELSLLACLSVVVNYIMFMTFFPACLSLVLELSHSGGSEERPVWQLSSLTKVLQLESEQTPNPVTQRVKLIMSAGLVAVHALSRFQVDSSSSSSSSSTSLPDFNSNSQFHSSSSVNNPSSSSPTADYFSPGFFENHFKNFLCADHIFLVVVVSALAVRYVFFESKEHHTHESVVQQRRIIMKDVVRDIDSGRPSPENPTITVSHDSDTESAIIEQKLKNGGSTGRKGSRRFFIGDDSSSEASSASDEGIIETVDSEVQTIESALSHKLILPKSSSSQVEMRPIEVLLSMINNEDRAKEVTDEEVLMLCQKKTLQPYRLEAALNDPERGVHIRRLLLASLDPRGESLENLPYTSYDYSKVMGACCENVVGYVPIPVGVAGPLLLNGKEYHVPMATTEGCLVASTNRGCRAIKLGGGAAARVVDDFMTRAPCVSFSSAIRAAEVYVWLKDPDNFNIVKEAFDSTSRFARLIKIEPQIAGHLLFIRLEAETGDAMGMNMLSKGAEIAMNRLKDIFPDMQIVALSGNTCTDKKPSANNWTKGRGKKVVAEATIPARVVEDVLKTDVPSILALNVNKNLIGSAIAGSIGGFNAHAANIVTAVYLATGQDPAQNVGSSNCITLVTAIGPENKDLRISVTMPSMEVGTIGGGTILPAQSACLDLLGIRGSNAEFPSKNSKQLSQIICATVLAGELSILSALAAGHLVRSHMKHNRSTLSMNAVGSCPNFQSSRDIKRQDSSANMTNGGINHIKETWAQGSCKM